MRSQHFSIKLVSKANIYSIPTYYEYVRRSVKNSECKVIDAHCTVCLCSQITFWELHLLTTVLIKIIK